MPVRSPGAAAPPPCAGPVSPANSLVGTHADDQIGGSPLFYGKGTLLVPGPSWDNGSLVDAGAITISKTWKPPVGAVSAANSVLGLAAGDGNYGHTKCTYDLVHDQVAIGYPYRNRITFFKFQDQYTYLPAVRR